MRSEIARALANVLKDAGFPRQDLLDAGRAAEMLHEDVCRHIGNLQAPFAATQAFLVTLRSTEAGKSRSGERILDRNQDLLLSEAYRAAGQSLDEALKQLARDVLWAASSSYETRATYLRDCGWTV